MHNGRLVISLSLMWCMEQGNICAFGHKTNHKYTLRDFAEF